MNSAAPDIHSFADAPWYVHAHLATALLALAIGVAILLRGKGTPSHRFLGRCWAALMIFTAATSFFIQGRDRLSLIHVLSVIVLVTVPTAIVLIRRGNVLGHAITMISTFVGLVIAGAFTLLPYRMLGQLVFGAG